MSSSSGVVTRLLKARPQPQQTGSVPPAMRVDPADTSATEPVHVAELLGTWVLKRPSSLALSHDGERITAEYCVNRRSSRPVNFVLECISPSGSTLFLTSGSQGREVSSRQVLPNEVFEVTKYQATPDVTSLIVAGIQTDVTIHQLRHIERIIKHSRGLTHLQLDNYPADNAHEEKSAGRLYDLITDLLDRRGKKLKYISLYECALSEALLFKFTEVVQAQRLCFAFELVPRDKTVNITVEKEDLHRLMCTIAVEGGSHLSFKTLATSSEPLLRPLIIVMEGMRNEDPNMLDRLSDILMSAPFAQRPEHRSSAPIKTRVDWVTNPHFVDQCADEKQNIFGNVEPISLLYIYVFRYLSATNETQANNLFRILRALFSCVPKNNSKPGDLNQIIQLITRFQHRELWELLGEHYPDIPKVHDYLFYLRAEVQSRDPKLLTCRQAFLHLVKNFRALYNSNGAVNAPLAFGKVCKLIMIEQVLTGVQSRGGHLIEARSPTGGRYGENALSIALREEDPSMVLALLACGADVNAEVFFPDASHLPMKIVDYAEHYLRTREDQGSPSCTYIIQRRHYNTVIEWALATNHLNTISMHIVVGGRYFQNLLTKPINFEILSDGIENVVRAPLIYILNQRNALSFLAYLKFIEEHFLDPYSRRHAIIFESTIEGKNIFQALSAKETECARKFSWQPIGSMGNDAYEYKMSLLNYIRNMRLPWHVLPMLWERNPKNSKTYSIIPNWEQYLHEILFQCIYQLLDIFPMEPCRSSELDLGNREVVSKLLWELEFAIEHIGTTIGFAEYVDRASFPGRELIQQLYDTKFALIEMRERLVGAENYLGSVFGRARLLQELQRSARRMFTRREPAEAAAPAAASADAAFDRPRPR